jgi:hypothetical protein
MPDLLLSQSAKRRLLTLAKAHDTWEMAVLAWRRLRASGVEEGGRDYDLLAMPVVTLYARPFTRCGGLSPLAGYDDFSAAPNPTAFAENHRRMLKARNMLVAHVDIPGSQSLIEGREDFERTDFLAVRLEADGSYSFETKSLLPNLVGNLGVPSLLAFQFARLGSETATEAERLLGRNISTGEVYRLLDRETTNP